MIQLKTKNFNLKYTLECGQCFRRKKIDNFYIQILSDRVVKLEQNWEYLNISSNKPENLEETIKNYFDLYEDYGKIENQISKIDKNIKNAVKNTNWLRILNQEFFETVISYIISANNNIPRISKSINLISENFWKKVSFEGNEYYLFPDAKSLKNATLSDLKSCWVWYRAEYIIDTTSKFYNWELNCNINHSYPEYKKYLLKFKWIWSKVADCILLFSLQKKESFPIDTRVEKVMNELYIHNQNDKDNKKEIQKYVKNNFWKYAWLIQEHLFYNKRMWRI